MPDVEKLNVNALYDIADATARATATAAQTEVAGIRTGADGTAYETAGEAVRTQFESLKAAAGAQELTDWTEGRAIELNVEIGAAVRLTPVNNANMKYMIVDCEENEAFTLNGFGLTAARAYGFIDENDILLDVAPPKAYYRYHVVYAPPTAKKMIIQRHLFSYTDNGTFRGIVSAPVIEDAIPLTREPITMNIRWEKGSVDNTGLSNSTQNIRTWAAIALNPNEKLIVENTSDDLYTAVYSAQKNTFLLGSPGGYLIGRNKIELYDTTCVYFVRARRRIMSPQIEPSEGENNVIITIAPNENAVPPLVGRYPSYNSYGNLCIKRTYSNLSAQLTAQRKDIAEDGTMSDSTTRCIIPLPKHGPVEVRQLKYGTMFKIVAITSGTPRWLVSDWSYYTYRYIGDGVSEYYCLVARTPEGTSELTPDTTMDEVGVFSFYDIGVKSNLRGSRLKGRKVAVIGDSITQGRFAKFGTTLNGTATKPFPELVAEEANDPNGGNYGIGGALVSNYAGQNWKSLETNCGKVSGYGTVFVCGGTNDFGSSVPAEEFKASYTYVVDTLMANNTEVVLCTPVVRSNKDTSNSAGLALYDYANIIRTIAEEKGLKCIDLYALTNNGVFITYLPDGLHPNEIGHYMIAKCILDAYGYY